MTSFSTLRCWKCKEQFGVLPSVEEVLRRSGQTFYCPWGHAAVFNRGPTEEDKLRQERDRLKQEKAQLLDEARMERDRRERAERRASAARGQVTRLKNRAAAGVCPCCNQTFAQLARHMAAKHPTFTAEEVAPDGATIQ